MTKSPSFQWYPQDILSSMDVTLMSPEEECAYRRLLDYSWVNTPQCYLPNDPDKLAPLCKASKETFEAIFKSISFKFKTKIIDGVEYIYNQRLLNELKKQEARRERLREAGKKGGRPKKQNLKKRLSSSSSSSSSTSASQKDTPLESPLNGFDEFWREYPRKVAKQDAIKAWKKRRPGKQLSEDIAEAIKRQNEAHHFRGRDGEDYVPNPATWLNQGRWEDEINKAQPSTPQKTTATAEPYLGRSVWTPPQYTAEQLSSVADAVKRVRAAAKGDTDVERVRARLAAVEAEVKRGVDADLLRAALAKEAG